MKIKYKLNTLCSPQSFEKKQSLNVTDSKRFVRKNQKSTDSLKSSRIAKTPKQQKNANNSKPLPSQSPKVMETIQNPSYINHQKFIELVKNDQDISFTKKTPENKVLSSFRSKHKNIITQTSQVYQWDYRQELQLKDKEILILEDENKRLKEKIEEHKKDKKELALELKKSENKCSKLIGENKTFSQKIKNLEDELLPLNQRLQSFCLKYETLVQENQKLIVQIEHFARNLPTDCKKLQSRREISLQRQLQQNKKIQKKSISQRQEELEKQIQYLKETHTNSVDNLRSLSISNRVLTKKVSMQEHIHVENMKLVDQVGRLKNKCKKLKSQNQILKKNNQSNKVLQEIKYSRKNTFGNTGKSQDSLSFNLSNNSN